MLTGEKRADELVKAPDRHFKNHNPKPPCALRRDWKWWFRYNFEEFLLCLKSYLYNYHPPRTQHHHHQSTVNMGNLLLPSPILLTRLTTSDFQPSNKYNPSVAI